MAFMKSARLFAATVVLIAAGAVPASASTINTYDTDGDGIPNAWEISGYDADGDGTVDVDYPGMGANPYRKDIFVEMDYMPGELATEADLDRITEVFASLPLRNPDGTRGVSIHLDAGPARSAKYNLGGGNEIPHQKLNGMGDWAALKHRHFASARDAGFHYMIWGDYYGNTSSSGLGFTGARGFIVTVGHTYWRGASSDIRVGTFIHELGHNLGLRHGGADEENYKPNYLSIMNYEYQLSGVPRAGGKNYFGYSTHEHMPLDEKNLDERRGLGANAYGYLYKGKPAHRNVDFNKNGVIDAQPVAADVNGNRRMSTLRAKSDMKTLRFAASATSRGVTSTPRTDPYEVEVDYNEVTAEFARERGLLP